MPAYRSSGHSNHTPMTQTRSTPLVNSSDASNNSVVGMYSLVNAELGVRYQPFLNYGYDGISSEVQDLRLPLAARDIELGMHMNLYRYVASTASVRDKDVLEIGSGRGGGAYLLKNYLGARRVAGLEYLDQSVSISKSTFAIRDLTFVQGDAEQLPFPSESQDVVINIESSHCYPNLKNFFREVERVLRLGGCFCYADLLPRENVPLMESALAQTSLSLEKSECITANVLKSLWRDNDRKLQLIRSMGLSFEREVWWINEWACVGTAIWRQLNEGELIYKHCVLRKR